MISPGTRIVMTSSSGGGMAWSVAEVADIGAMPSTDRQAAIGSAKVFRTMVPGGVAVPTANGGELSGPTERAAIPGPGRKQGAC